MSSIKFCKNCLMPNTRPNTGFDEAKGLCQACLNFGERREVDWDARFEELKDICSRHKREGGGYDCIVPVSGGKDSYFLTYMAKVELGMNPLLVTVVDQFGKWDAGVRNLKNIARAFDCDHYVFSMSPKLFRETTRIGFEELGEPLRFLEVAIYTVPFKLAASLGIGLVFWGEDSKFEYGDSSVSTGSAADYTDSLFERADPEFWVERGVSKSRMDCVLPPGDAKPVEPIYLGHFVGWSSMRNLGYAKRYGFRTLANECDREGCAENFEGVDSIGYQAHAWMKYPKFGFQRTTDVVSRFIRNGNMSKEEGARLILEKDHCLDQNVLDDFCKTVGYSPEEFWGIVEGFWNRDIFEKVDGVWRFKKSVADGFEKVKGW